MEEITIYKYQLEEIIEAFRLTNNIYHTRDKKTCYDRIVTRAEQYAQNAIEGKKDRKVGYV